LGLAPLFAAMRYCRILKYVELLTLHVTASCIIQVIIGCRKLESVIQGHNVCTILHENRSDGSKIERICTLGLKIATVVSM